MWAVTITHTLFPRRGLHYHFIYWILAPRGGKSCFPVGTFGFLGEVRGIMPLAPFHLYPADSVRNGLGASEMAQS